MKRFTVQRTLRKMGGVLGALALLGFSAAAEAAPIGYQLDIFGSLNSPTFLLTNDAASTANIVSFNFTIGDTTRNFDFVDVSATSITFTLSRPDTLNDAVRTDEIDFTFNAGFTPGSVFQFLADPDSDASAGTTGSIEDFTTVFFNNGAALNSMFSVGFAGGYVLSLTLPENPSTVANSQRSNHYRFAQTAVVQTSSVPEPGTLALFGAGLTGLALVRRRTRG